MAFNPCDLTWASLRGTCSRRVVRHENQKGFRADTNADCITQTSKACRAESFAASVSDGFAKEEEDFSDSISDCDTEEQIKAQKSEWIAHAGSRRNSVANSSGNSYTFASAAFRAGKKRRAKRQPFA